MTAPSSEPTLGEVSRGLSRVEREMHEGFAGIRREIAALSFVPSAVYSADRLAYQERVERLEEDLAEDRRLRRDEQQTLQQRAWQAKWSIVLALVGMPISILGAVIVAGLVAALGLKN